MKKRFFLLTAMAAVLFSGCQQEDDFRSMSADSQDITKVIITAELESTKATRTSTVSDGTNVSILWSEDDSLSVLMNGLKSHALFTIHDIDEEGTSAHFIGQNVIISGGTSGSDAEDAANVAIYPYTADANITDKAYNAETGEHSFCMPFPHVQQYAADGSVGNRAFPMVAVSESNYHVGFGFRPVAAGVRIGLKGAEGTKVKTIMVQSSKQKIAGKAAVTASYAGMPTIAIDQTEGINNIILDCGEEGVALNPETVTQFTVALPPITVEENELTFTIYDTEGGFMEYVYDGAFEFARNTHYNLNKIGTYVATKKNPLAHALDQAGEGDVVNFTLAGDMKVTSQLSVGWESLNLDLNGFTLDLGDNALRFDGGYTFVPNVINIYNGTIKSNYSYCIFSYGIPSAITLTDVTLEGKGGIQVQGLAKNLTLNNVTMNVTGNGLNETLAHELNSKVTINGGTYKVGKLFNSFEQADDITINGGKFNKTYTHKNVVWASREGEADADVYPYTASELSHTVDDAGNVTIYSAAGLKWLAEQVNGGDSFSKKTVTLANDIDLAGEEYAIIGLPDAPFSGTFDGQDHTIKNLDIVDTEAKDEKAYIGFFGYAKDATIKNVIFENVNLNIACKDIDHSQGHIGAVAGSLEGKSLIEDVTVKGNIKVEATFDANGASRVAVVAGGNSYGDVTMRNVHVVANEGSYLKSNNNLGALAGQLQGKNVFENCSSNINVTGKKFFAGGIIGLAAGNSTFTDCHTTGNVTITAGREGNANDHYRVGGIAGGWADNKTTPCVLTDCTYTGTVSGTNADSSVANPLDYSGYVGRGYTLAGNEGSTVIIDGVKYIQIGNTPPYGNYNVVDTNYPIFIGETGYATLAEAVAAAGEGETITLQNNYESAANTEIKIGTGKSIILDLNEKTLSSTNSVKATHTNFILINGGKLEVKNGRVEVEWTGENMVWDGGSNIFNVTAGGELVMNNVVTEHLGGTDMNFAVHLNNWGEVTLTADNCEFLATYCGVRAFNSGFDNNNIKITNSKLTGKTRAFWVHNYFGDFTDARHTEEAVIARLKIDIYNNNNTFEITGEAKSPIRYGFSSPVYFDETGKKVWPVENFTFDEETKTYTVLTPAGLSEALSAAGAAGSGNSTIEISGDLNMEGVEWTPIKVDGYNGADIVTVEGNGAIITNLSAPLFEGGFAGGSGIVIQNLTIADSEIVVTNTQGGGSFINCADSMDEITLINCHAENVTLITPNDGADESRLGGLIGWTAGYNNQNDGPVDSYITVKNCSVKGCNIKCAGSVGGIIGHSGANAATFTKIENCTVTGNTLTSTDDGGWRVGVVVGTANNGQTTITGITESGNTVAQTGKTAPEGEKRNYFGRFVPAGTGSLTIDGAWYVTSAAELTAAIANEELSNVALLPATYAGTFAVNRQVNLVSAENTKAVINGRVNISSTGSGSAFENIDFTVSDESTVKNVFTGTNYQYPALVMIYAAAATFEGCSFETDITKSVAGINYGAHAAGKVLTVDKCEFNGDFYPIRSRALLSVTDSKFNSTYNGNGLSAVWLWGLNAQGGTTTGSVVFKGNTATSPSGVSLAGVVMAASNYLYNYLTFDVQGNTGFSPIYGTTSSCTYSNNTFVEGSETF